MKLFGPAPIPSALQAMISDAEGLTLPDEERCAEAYEQFEKALEQDSGIEWARLKTESLRPLLDRS